MNVIYVSFIHMKTYCSVPIVICRSLSAQKVNAVLVHVKKDVQQSSECMSAIVNIVVQLFLHTDDGNKVLKPLMQVITALTVASKFTF